LASSLGKNSLFEGMTYKKRRGIVLPFEKSGDSAYDWVIFSGIEECNAG
jgi:hypothetical protein